MRLIARLVVLVALVVAGLSVSVPTAHADVICTVHGPVKVCCDKKTSICKTIISKPGGPGTAPSPPPGKPGGPAKPPPCVFGKQEVPCSGASGTWSNANQCYMHVEDPPPAYLNAPPDSTAYLCTPPGGGAARTVWVKNGAPPPPPPPPDPAVVAQMIVKSMQLTPPEFADTFAPRPVEANPASMGAVGLPVWMAVARSPRTTGPLTVTASLGGTTVTATAAPISYDWHLGGGVTHRCATTGTVFHVGDGVVMSPDCGVRYLKVSSHAGYPVTVTAHWVVTWTGAGATGQIPLDLTSPVRHIRIGELQAVGVSG